MVAERRAKLQDLCGAVSGDPDAVLRRVCEVCVTECSVSGASITVQGTGTGADTAMALAWATDSISEQLDDVQRTVGEGPGTTAHTDRGPVLVPDLTTEGARWPGFTMEAQKAGAAAVFAFPLQVGAVRVGVLDTYRTTAGPLSGAEFGDALILADIATYEVLNVLAGQDAIDMGWLPDIHAEVHQATGIVTAQLGLTMSEALVRIRAHAFSHQLALDDVAHQIVHRHLYLETGA
ncbi:ANTAR domain-containing protein [Amycolatopsis antarctica]|uniref:ANTAR domain-containing protein n=1 Tax=Amycolatopsis antarctica TaxID=1854586 RepID=UPI0010556433|nr:ANTAR domain-containing protein [Amycolatopsis antarctica]